MKKINSIPLTSLEIKSQKQSYSNLLDNFVIYCEENNFTKNSYVDFSNFIKINKISFLKAKIFAAILYIRGYMKHDKLLQTLPTLKDNVAFRKNKVFYIFKNFLNKKK